MLVLFETPAGFALFKILDEGKLSKVEVLPFFFLEFIVLCIGCWQLSGKIREIFQFCVL